MSDEAKEQFVEECLQKLSEHFDAVQILACSQEGGECTAVYRGSGLWYARMGMAHEFIENDKSQITARDLSAAIRPDDNENLA